MRVKYKLKHDRILVVHRPKVGFIVRFNTECHPDGEKFDRTLSKLEGMGFTWHGSVSKFDIDHKYKPIATGLGLRLWSDGWCLVWSNETTWEEYGFMPISFEEFYNNNYKIVKVEEDEDSL